MVAVASRELAVGRMRRDEQRWRVWNDHGFTTPQQGFVVDRELGVAVANGAQPTYRLWTSPRSLAVSRQDSHLPAFADASRSMADTGWPVIVRDTGGSAVALGPGILNLSMVLPRSLLAGLPGTAMESVYALLCGPIRQTLATLGILTSFASVPTAFCDGRFNLAVNGKKIAGTAQVWRALAANGGGYVLAQAALLVNVDVRKITDVVNRFYSLVDRPARFDGNSIVSVRDCLESSGGCMDPAPGLLELIREMLASYCERGDRAALADFS